MFVKNSPQIDRFKRGDLVLYNTIGGYPRGLGVFLHSRMITMAKRYVAVMTKGRVKYLPPVDCEIIASL